MHTDSSWQLFEQFNKSPEKLVRMELADGNVVQGHIIGFYRGLRERGESFIFRWRILPSQEPLTDYDRTLNPDQGIIVEHKTVRSFMFL